jgi:hypothetical protein
MAPAKLLLLKSLSLASRRYSHVDLRNHLGMGAGIVTNNSQLFGMLVAVDKTQSVPCLRVDRKEGLEMQKKLIVTYHGESNHIW